MQKSGIKAVECAIGGEKRTLFLGGWWNVENGGKFWHGRILQNLERNIDLAGSEKKTRAALENTSKKTLHAEQNFPMWKSRLD